MSAKPAATIAPTPDAEEQAAWLPMIVIAMGQILMSFNARPARLVAVGLFLAAMVLVVISPTAG
jgi:hypothetical protein